MAQSTLKIAENTIFGGWGQDGEQKQLMEWQRLNKKVRKEPKGYFKECFGA